MAQPTTYQEMVSNMLATKVQDGKTYVPMLTNDTDPGNPAFNQDFDVWRDRTGRFHVGIDLIYGELQPDGAVKYLGATASANQNVSIGAPVDGVMHFVGGSTNQVTITREDGVVFALHHMTDIDLSLDGQFVTAGTHLGIMAGVRADAIVHDHLSIYSLEPVPGSADKVEKVFYDPQQFIELGPDGSDFVRQSQLTDEGGIVRNVLADVVRGLNPFGVGDPTVTYTRTTIPLNDGSYIVTTVEPQQGQIIIQNFGPGGAPQSSSTSTFQTVYDANGVELGGQTTTVFSNGDSRTIFVDAQGARAGIRETTNGVTTTIRNGITITTDEDGSSTVSIVGGSQAHTLNPDGTITLLKEEGTVAGTITFDSDDFGGGTFTIGNQMVTFTAADEIAVSPVGRVSKTAPAPDGSRTQTQFYLDGSMLITTWNSDGSYVNSLSSTVGTTGPVDNSIADFSTAVPGGPVQSTAGDSNVFLNGLAMDDPSYTLQVNPAYLNGDGLANVLSSGLVTDFFRPGAQEEVAVYPGSLLNVFDPTLFGQQYSLTPTSPLGAQLQTSLAADLFASAGFILNVDPLVLDLNGDGIKLTDYQSSPVFFDIDHDGGSLELTGWVSAQDGIVVVDRSGDGIINDSSEMLSEYYGGAPGQKPFTDGFAALASLDSNHDGKFDAADAAFGAVRVWVDANHDAKTDPGELHTLSQLGITRINLTATPQSGEVIDGNEVLSRGSYTTTAGVTRDAAAINFLANPVGHTFTPSGSGTKVTTEGGVTSYVTQNSTGEVINVAAKGVQSAYGGTGNDTLIGDAGSNWLAGGPGSDTFQGGAGNDALIIDAAYHHQNIDVDDGFDIVQVVGDAGVTFNLAQAHVEVAQGGRGNDVLIGGGRANVFIAGGAGDDIIIGG